jgi:hypothetical protein
LTSTNSSHGAPPRLYKSLLPRGSGAHLNTSARRTDVRTSVGLFLRVQPLR